VSKNIEFSGIKYWPIALVGLIAMLFVGLNPQPREGLEFLWLLPLSFAICLLLFSKIIDCHKGGVGLKILYVIIIIRYIVSPVLITVTKEVTGSLWIFPSSDGYHFAIAISIVELFVCCITIKYFWEKCYKNIRVTVESNNKSNQNISLTFGGLLIISILMIIILSRGLEGVLSSFGFLMLKGKYTVEYVDNYAVVTIQVLKSFIFICIVSWAFKKYQKKNNILWMLVACVAAFFNVTTYFGYNRSLIFQTAAASIFTLYAAFPKMKKTITLMIVPVVVAVLYSLITIKQFGLSAQSVSLFNLASLKNWSNTIESYVNGMWPLASSFDAANALRYKMTLFTVLRDITDNFFLFKVPGFMWVNNGLSDITSTVQLYNTYTFPATGSMIPLAGQMWFYGGFILGPFLTIAANVLVIYLLVKFEIISKLQKNIQTTFLYSWLASLFGLIMCYCLITLWWSMSKFAFFLIIVFWINNKFSVTHKKMREEKKNEYFMGL
jgi:hypothetical protein